MQPQTPSYLIAGQLRREYLILPNDQALLDVPGGNLLYAAVGVAIWEPDPPPGVVARVGEDYPPEWLGEFARRGLDTRGIRVLAQAVDLRSFTAYTSRSTYTSEDPVSHFARIGIPFPKELLGYRSPANALDSRINLSPTSIRQADIPPEFYHAGLAHLCPLDYLTHTLLPAVLRQAEFTTVTLDPSPGYMNPTYWDDIPALITGLTAFHPSEEELRSLFPGRSTDLWEMAEALAAYGCVVIVINRGEGGQWLYEAPARRRWEVPAFPARVAVEQVEGGPTPEDGAGARTAEVHEDRARRRSGIRVDVELEGDRDRPCLRGGSVERHVHVAAHGAGEGVPRALVGHDLLAGRGREAGRAPAGNCQALAAT